jgi:NADH-quinone oxidoreductase subunit M
VLVVLSVWNFSYALTVITAFAVILTAGYILWTLQRVYLGPEYKGPHGDHLHEMTHRETAIAAPLLLGAIIFGVHPDLLLRYMEPTVKQQVTDLAEWTREHRPAGTAATVTQQLFATEEPALPLNPAQQEQAAQQPNAAQPQNPAQQNQPQAAQAAGAQ